MHLIEVAPNPIQRCDPALALALEKTVLETLNVEATQPLVVRFGLWSGEEDGPRYLCKVESLPSADAEAPPAWRWWSPLVRTPAELAGHLREAIRSRHQKLTSEPGHTRDFWGWGAVGQAGA